MCLLGRVVPHRGPPHAAGRVGQLQRRVGATPRRRSHRVRAAGWRVHDRERLPAVQAGEGPRRADAAAVEQLTTEARQDDAAPPLSVARLSEVRGVNALVPGAVIEPHEGLTILYGENGTGKTGYSRIFKALADSRTADEILGNIEAEKDEQQVRQDRLHGWRRPRHDIEWTGERGVSPFTRMSIFDSPSVTTHVDDDLDYVYVPAALALFNHVISAIQAVSSRVDDTYRRPRSRGSTLLSRFPKNSSAYPLIETLGASTDLEALRAKASTDPKVDEKIDSLTQAVAALKANTIGTQITARKREQRVVEQAAEAAAALLAFDSSHLQRDADQARATRDRLREVPGRAVRRR